MRDIHINHLTPKNSNLSLFYSLKLLLHPNKKMIKPIYYQQDALVAQQIAATKHQRMLLLEL
jgi:hypothetical protein